MISRNFWDHMADDGGPTLTHRQARQIIRTQQTFCRLRMDRPSLICTGGTVDHGPGLLEYALRVHFGYEPALPEPAPRRPRTRKAEA